jgi:hypothetical protein
MYENSGVTCVMLAWKIDDNEWEIVPEWAFTTASTPQTTTTTTTVPIDTVPATDPATTTTVQGNNYDSRGNNYVERTGYYNFTDGGNLNVR